MERYVRQAEDEWVLTAFGAMTQMFAFGTVPVRMVLADIYRGVEFPETNGR